MSVKLKKLFSHGGTISFLIGFFLYIFTVLPILINDNGIMTFMAITAHSRYRLHTI